MFTEDQKQALQAPLNRAHVKQREQSGRKLSYIEGWHAIDEANRIFGFDAWNRETVEIRCVAERERKIGRPPNQKDGWGVSYICKVRIVVDHQDGSTIGAVVREGIGSGHGIDVDLGLAHESAIKEAETDAMKRALMTFGNPFGLALYDKQQTNVCDERDQPTPHGRDESDAQSSLSAYKANFLKKVTEAETADALRPLWKEHEPMRDALGILPRSATWTELRAAWEQRGGGLSPKTVIISKEAAE